MKIHCAKKDLEKGMLTVIKAVSNKTPLPILGHVKMVSEGEPRRSPDDLFDPPRR